MPDPTLMNSLKCLRNAVATLPTSTPSAHQSGMVYRAFKGKPSGVSDEALMQMANAYTHCFVNPPSKKTPIDNIMRGPYGMECVLRYLDELIALPRLSESSLALIDQKVKQLTDLVFAR